MEAVIGIGRQLISSEHGAGRRRVVEVCGLLRVRWISRTARMKIVLHALVLGAYLCGTNGGAAGQSIANSSARYSPLHDSLIAAHLVTVEDLRVHYIEAGAGRTVVMIHGNAGNVEDFEFGTIQSR